MYFGYLQFNLPCYFSFLCLSEVISGSIFSFKHMYYCIMVSIRILIYEQFSTSNLNSLSKGNCTRNSIHYKPYTKLILKKTKPKQFKNHIAFSGKIICLLRPRPSTIILLTFHSLHVFCSFAININSMDLMMLE